MQNESQEKTIFSGSDGGAGFGVPPDYGLSDEIAKVPVINDDGTITNVPGKTKSSTSATYEVVEEVGPNGEITLILKASNVNKIVVRSDGIPVITEKPDNNDVVKELHVEKLYNGYRQLPLDNAIRKRAEDLEERYVKAVSELNEIKGKMDSQKELSPIIIEDIRSLQTKLINKTYKKTYDNNAAKMEDVRRDVEQSKSAILAKISNYGFSIDDISLSLNKAINSILESDDDSIESSLDTALQSLDDSLGEVQSGQVDGYGNILKEYQRVSKYIETLNKEIDQVSGDVQSSIRIMYGKTGGKSVHMSRTTKKNYRLLDTMNDKPLNKSIDTGIPDNVPNYHLAIDSSPRVCGNCRFFQGETGVNGNCKAFDFTAKANYLCDAWQSQNLLPIHTPVRANIDGYSTYTGKADMIYVDGKPKESPGMIQGDFMTTVPLADVEYQVEYPNTPMSVIGDRYPIEGDNAALRANDHEFIPGDIVFSKSFNAIAQVNAVSYVDKVKVYGLKLIGRNGVAYGSGYSYGSDLIPRSSKATKRNPYKSVTDDVKDMEEVVRNVYRALRTIVTDHEDVTKNPLSNQDVLTPLRSQLVEVMETPLFVNSTTGPKRKYYRAVQAAVHAVGAARQILFEGYKTINVINRSTKDGAEIRSIMLKCQNDAMERVKYALSEVEDSLTLPSATHNTDAPGIESNE